MPQSVATAWTLCLRELDPTLTGEGMRPWIQAIRFVDYVPESRELRLEVPDTRFMQRFTEQVLPSLQQDFDTRLGTRSSVRLRVRQQMGRPHLPGGRPRPTGGRQRLPGQQAPAVRRHVLPYAQTQLNKSYDFASLIQGDCNQLARSAALAISATPGQTNYNPFFVYGAVGLGKTHLVQALGNEVYHRHRLNVVYLTGETFTAAFIKHVKENSISVFKSFFYHHVDVLIVDDIQFLTGKEKTQEEFYHIFNDLHQQGKQIVLCADKPPSEIKGLEERLLSRLKWGLTADVQRPDLETRIAIVQQKAESLSLELPPDVVEFIATHVHTSVRALEGVVNKLFAQAQFEPHIPRTLEHVKTILTTLNEPAIVVSLGDITRVVAEHVGLNEADLLGRSRRRQVSQARQLAMYLCREATHHSLARIGRFFGGRDHSTVIHACNVVEDQLTTDRSTAELVASLRRALGVREG